MLARGRGELVDERLFGKDVLKPGWPTDIRRSDRVREFALLVLDDRHLREAVQQIGCPVREIAGQREPDRNADEAACQTRRVEVWRHPGSVAVRDDIPSCVEAPLKIV